MPPKAWVLKEILRVFWILSLQKIAQISPDLIRLLRSYVVSSIYVVELWKILKEGNCVSDQTCNSGSHCAFTSTGNYNNNVEFDVKCQRVRTSFCADERTNTIVPLQTFHCKVQQKTLEVISWIKDAQIFSIEEFYENPWGALIFALGCYIHFCNSKPVAKTQGLGTGRAKWAWAPQYLEQRKQVRFQ